MSDDTRIAATHDGGVPKSFEGQQLEKRHVFLESVFVRPTALDTIIPAVLTYARIRSRLLAIHYSSSLACSPSNLSYFSFRV